MKHILQKEHQTEVLRKTTQAKNKHHQRESPRDVIDHNLRDQLCRRQQVIEKIYKRSVANKLYIFPRMSEDIENVSLGSNSSIEEMDHVERYKLTAQNHQSNVTIKNNINYFSQSVASNNHEDSKTKIDLRKFRTKYSSNKKLLDSASVEKIVHSSRVNPQTILFKNSVSKKKEQSTSLSVKKESKPRNYSSIYQQILSKVGLKMEKQSKDKSNSTSSITKKVHFTYRKIKEQNLSKDSSKNRYRLPNNEPSHNISVSKILEKYRTSSRKKEERCKTQY